jgi:predicted amidohydrolase YtcJ
MKNILSVFLSILFITTLSAQNMKTAFINGKIYTVNENQITAQAVVVENNKIIFVGSDDDANQFIDSSTNVINLEGKLMLPGFIDNHVHFITGGFYLLGIDLRPANSTTEFRKILNDYVEKYPTRWITGGYWDHEKWEVKDLPTKEMIDDISPNTPVFVERLDGHMGLANSYALKLAGVTKDTESPDGGLIVKNPKTGEPTGVLKDNAMSFIYNILPAATAEENYDAALAALEEAKRLGITSVQDITFEDALTTFTK